MVCADAQHPQRDRAAIAKNEDKNKERK